MKINAFICSTPVQLMRAIHMTLRYDLCSGVSDLYLMNSIPNANFIINRLKDYKIFKNVYLIKLEVLKNHFLFRLLFCHNTYSRLVKSANYNQIFGFNIDNEFTQSLVHICKKNKDFVYHCVEDTPAIYPIYEPPKYPWYHVYKLFGIDKEIYLAKYWWSSMPDMISLPESFKLEKRKLIPISINDDEYISIVNKIFNYQENADVTNADAIIMDESHYVDGLMKDNYDLYVFNKIKTHYPNKTFLVKLHPRTKYNRYCGKFNCLNDIGIPWELIILNGLNKDKKFTQKILLISIVCATMLSDYFMFGIEGKKLVLAPLFKDKISKSPNNDRVSTEIINVFFDVKNKYANKNNFMIASTEKDIYTYLDCNLK